MAHLRVFTFSPDWGLPTTGPFALKLLGWLQLAGMPWEQVIENNAGKGPLGKNPWIEIDGQVMADSELIIAELARRSGFDIDARLSDTQRVQAHLWRRTFEEHFHQVLEWELFVHPNGAAYINAMVAKQAPPVVRDIVSSRVRKHFSRQLRARGIGRHPPAAIAAKGRADIDALAAHLSGRAHLIADEPCMADLAVFGQVAPMVRWPMDTPVANHAKRQRAVVDFIDRMQALCFAEQRAAA